MRVIAIVVCFWMAELSWAEKPEEPINDDYTGRFSDGISLTPVAGYDPSYGLVIGGAIFRGDTTPPISNASLFLYGTFRSIYAAELRFKILDRDNMFYTAELEASNFYDPYFGEGNVSAKPTKMELNNFKVAVNPGVFYRFDRKSTLGILSELRYRNETGIDGDSTRRLFGEDFSPILGVNYLYDCRNHEVDTKSGQFYSVRVDVGPSLLSTRSGAETFTRIEGEALEFISLGESLVLAGQLRVGTSIGEPGYQYRFSLGGSRKLRGFERNRLRGRHFYLGQAELRLTIHRWVGLVGFGGVGDVGDVKLSDFKSPLPTGGIGLRIGLPPDFVAKLRFDLGFSSDGMNFYMNFNEAF